MNNLNVIDNEFCHAGAPARRRSMSGAPYLRKSGNPLISKLSVITCLSVCPHAEPNSLKYESSTINIGTSLILEIHLMVNWRLPKQGIC